MKVDTEREQCWQIAFDLLPKMTIILLFERRSCMCICVQYFMCSRVSDRQKIFISVAFFEEQWDKLMAKGQGGDKEEMDLERTESVTIVGMN